MHEVIGLNEIKSQVRDVLDFIHDTSLSASSLYLSDVQHVADFILRPFRSKSLAFC